MSSLLIYFALGSLPCFPLLGGLLLLFALLREFSLCSQLGAKINLLLSAWEKRLLVLMALFSLLTLFAVQHPLYHLAGFFSHYLLPGIVTVGLFSGLSSGRIASQHLRWAFLMGACLLAMVGFCNYFGDWQGHFQAFELPFFDRPFLLDLSLAPALGRAGGPALNSNLLGLMMALAWPLAFFEYQNRKKKLARLLWAGICLLLLLVLGVSFSRGAWLGLFMAQLLLLTVPHLRKQSLIVLLLETALLLLPQSQGRINSLFRAEYSSNDLRMQIYMAGFQMLSDFWSSGTGILHVDLLYPAYQIADRGSAHLHNALLQIGVESGIFFALFVLCLAVILFYQARFEPVLQSVWLALIVFSCFDYPFADFRVQIFVAVLLALQIFERGQHQQKGHLMA
jgi:O-antigen ligase